MALFPESELPCPRLELRRKDQPRDADGYTCFCEYNYVFPLQRLDIRAERWSEDGSRIIYGANRECTVNMGKTRSTHTAAEHVRENRVETPYRDGSHIQWDRIHFGNAPMFAVADGKAMFIEPRPPVLESEDE